MGKHEATTQDLSAAAHSTLLMVSALARHEAPGEPHEARTEGAYALAYATGLGASLAGSDI